jgi:hypothetical protein
LCAVKNFWFITMHKYIEICWRWFSACEDSKFTDYLLVDLETFK